MKECDLEKQRQKRKAEGNATTHRYEKTKSGFLMRLYRNMTSRVTGVQASKHHLYEGKPLIEKDLFYAWARSSGEFHRLFETWEKSGHDRKLCPSVDRVDSSQGYLLWNMEWVTHSENSRRGGCSQRRVKAK